MATLSEAKLKRHLDLLRRELREKLERRVEGFEEDRRSERIASVQGDLLGFVGLYLPHFMPGGAYSDFHREFARMLGPLLAGKAPKRPGLKLAFAAPRGNGKTSLVKALVIMAVVYELKRFVVLVSDTLEQAAEILDAVKLELEANPRLKADFPEATGQGPHWALGQVVSSNGVKLKAFGTGKKIRGASHGVFRPDLILVDDLENDEAVRSGEQRQKIEDWFWKSLVPLGPPDGSADLLVAGTLLHYDSVLARLLKHPGFEARKFRALLNWPARMDLWEQFERLYWTQGKQQALDFFTAQHAAMKQGAQLLWPQVQTLLALMLKWAENRAAFNSEQQNEPIDQNQRVFRHFHYWEELPPDLVCFGALDPSMGKANRGTDPSALIILGRDGAGRCYVIEARIKRLAPDDLIEEVIALQETYKCLRWAVEVVQFQEFFKGELVRRAAERGTPVPAEGVRPNRDKLLRIESIQPHVHNGLIRLHRSQTQLLDQLTYFPQADHDDGPDALQMAFALAAASQKARVQSAPARRQTQGFEGY